MPSFLFSKLPLFKNNEQAQNIEHTKKELTSLLFRYLIHCPVQAADVKIFDRI